MNKKGFVNIVLILILVAFVGVGAYFVSTQETNTPTSNLTSGSTTTADTIPSLPSTQTT